MATINYVIFDHHKNTKGESTIKIRLTHKGKQVYRATIFRASPLQLKKDNTIKDQSLLRSVNKYIDTLWDRLESIGHQIDNFTAKELLQRITQEPKVVQIDFISFCRQHLDVLKENGKTGTLRALTSPYNHLVDFTGGSYDIREIDTLFLKEFERYLMGPRVVKRKKAGGGMAPVKLRALERSGVFKVMANVRIFYNHCRKHYNSKSAIIIKNNPFEYYDMPVPIAARKKGGDLSVDDIIALRDATLTGRKELGRDIFMLSFYMCGLNMIDLYNGGWSINDGRLEYNRSKVKDRRSDAGFISIRIPDPALPLLEKYTSDYLQRRYSTYTNFNAAVNKGLGDITFYHARHTFATLASKEFGYSDPEIGFALNHSAGSGVTSRYIATDWSKIDRIQSDVLSLLASDKDI